MRGIALVLLCGSLASCTKVASIEPSKMMMLTRGMPRTAVQLLLGAPASVGMSSEGQESWEYKEYRWSFSQGQRELVASYELEFKDGTLSAWKKSGGAQYRPAVDRGTTVLLNK